MLLAYGLSASAAQAVDRWCGHYPRDLKASVSALDASAAGSRPWLAAAVCVGEELLLQQLKKGALMIMLGAAEVGWCGWSEEWPSC
jgi:hypothetical protein